MADMIPLKYNATGPKAASLGQYDTGDSVPVIHGGTGKVSIAINKFLYSSAANVYSEADLTVTGRELLAVDSKTDMRAYLGLVIGTNAGQVITASSNGRLPALDGRNLTNTLPAGIIVFWSGTIASIPSNFKLCDGTNSTPDLRDKFVVGAGLNYTPGATGGSTTHSHTITVQNTTLVVTQIPSHAHRSGIPRSFVTSAKDTWGYDTGIKPDFTTASPQNTWTEGGDQPHAHGATSATVSNLPPYYALAYIMSVTI